MAEPKKPIPVEDYHAVLAAAYLLDVKLIRSDFSVEAEFFSSSKDDHRFVFGCEQAAYHFGGDNRLIGTFNVEAGIKKSRRFLLRSKAVYLIAFAIEGEVSEDAALAYLGRVGAFGCWPYYRAHFAELCSSAGVDVAPLPVMRGSLPTQIEPAKAT